MSAHLQHTVQCRAKYINSTVCHIGYLRRLQFASILKEIPPSMITALPLIEYTAHLLMSKFS